MSVQQHINYHRIATAIDYIQAHVKEQPDLDEVAEMIHLSPFHFQRLFTEWAGVSPKKFLQYLTVSRAKQMLREKRFSLADTAFETGLSGTGRLHDLFINIEAMTPGEFKNGGDQLSINYSFASCPFGNLLVASTNKGLCYMAFTDDEVHGLHQFRSNFPNAALTQATDPYQQHAMQVFNLQWHKPAEIKLHLKGTPFQLKVWETLLKIPLGQLSAYGEIATCINKPRASRAVGSAVGDNPVAFIIPCHRVIRSSGAFGQYHWGSVRKTAIIGWEAAQVGRMN